MVDTFVVDLLNCVKIMFEGMGSSKCTIKLLLLLNLPLMQLGCKQCLSMATLA